MPERPLLCEKYTCIALRLLSQPSGSRTAPGHARDAPLAPLPPHADLAGRKSPFPARQAPYWWAHPREVQKISGHA